MVLPMLILQHYFFLHDISVEFLMIEIYETVIKPLIDVH